MITMTDAFMFALQATAEIKDNRKQGEELGYIEKDMTDREAIAQVLVNVLLMNTEDMTENEVLLRGQMMTSFLHDYYHEEILISFLPLYVYSTNTTVEDLLDNPISAYFDFDDVVNSGNKLGWKKKWNEFKEPYFDYWEEKIKN